MPKKRLTGIVISNKMQKTVVIEVKQFKKYPKYKRGYAYLRKYKAHDEKGVCKIGDKVTIEECRPQSKEKKWRVIKNYKP